MSTVADLQALGDQIARWLDEIPVVERGANIYLAGNGPRTPTHIIDPNQLREAARILSALPYLITTNATDASVRSSVNCP